MENFLQGIEVLVEGVKAWSLEQQVEGVRALEDVIEVKVFVEGLQDNVEEIETRDIIES